MNFVLDFYQNDLGYWVKPVDPEGEPIHGSTWEDLFLNLAGEIDFYYEFNRFL